ncbi:hypothetical protein TBS_17450 [Thermobispora bispora]
MYRAAVYPAGPDPMMITLRTSLNDLAFPEAVVAVASTDPRPRGFPSGAEPPYGAGRGPVCGTGMRIGHAGAGVRAG